MELSIQNILCFIIISISIIFVIKNVKENVELNDVVGSIISGTSTIITFLIMISNYNWFYKISTIITEKYFFEIINYRSIIQTVIIVAMFCIVKYLLVFVLKILNMFSITKVLNKTNNKFFLYFFSIIYGAIRGMVLIVLICIPLVLYNNIVDEENKINLMNGFSVYDKVENLVDYKKVQLISDGVKEEIEKNSVVYYNGVTIDDAVKSNKEIDDKAKELTSKVHSDRDKARKIYIWIGNNIEYDNDKAVKVVNTPSFVESGAIVTYETRKGICFDYACLYTAMCKAVGLKSRVIVGEAFSGNEYVSHAWNEAYLEDEKKWINVDATFYNGGDFFDSDNFNNYHIKSSVAGEF